MEELAIEKRVFLLAISKREEGEDINTTLTMLVDTGMFKVNEGRKILNELREAHYIIGENLSMTGVVEANKAEKEFKQ